MPWGPVGSHPVRRRVSRPALARSHPCAVAFLDESGAISGDRFFSVGVLKAQEPARLLRAVQKLRDQKHWYREIKFGNIRSAKGAAIYQEVIDLCLTPGLVEFFCFVADRAVADPIERFGSQWDAYGKLAEQLIVAATHPDELVSVIADNYSTPDHILFEEDVKAGVNARLSRLAVVTVCRLDSRSCDGLQLADLLTSAATHEFRAAAGLASDGSHKGTVARHLREALGAPSCLSGWRNASHSIQVYNHGSWTVPAGS